MLTSLPDPRRNAVDDLVVGRTEDFLEFGGEGDGEVERGDAQGRSLQRGEVRFGKARDELGAEAVGAAAFVQDDEAAGARERRLDGVEFQRRQGAEVEQVESL